MRIRSVITRLFVCMVAPVCFYHMKEQVHTKLLTMENLFSFSAHNLSFLSLLDAELGDNKITGLVRRECAAYYSLIAVLGAFSGNIARWQASTVVVVCVFIHMLWHRTSIHVV